MDIEKTIEKELHSTLEFDEELNQYIIELDVSGSSVICQFELELLEDEKELAQKSKQELLWKDYEVLQEIIKDIDAIQNMALATLQQLAGENEAPNFSLPNVIAVYPDGQFVFGFVAHDPGMDNDIIISVHFSASFVPDQKLQFDIIS